MDTLHHVRSVLEQAIFEERKGIRNPPPKPAPFITISRQTGAGGHSLAHAIIRELSTRSGNPLFQNWYLFDSLLCNQVLEDFNLRIPVSDLLHEKYHSPVDDFAFQLLANRPAQDDVVSKLRRILSALAARGHVIIIGRGGVGATQHLPGGLHLRLWAPLPVRIERMRDNLGSDEKTARQVIFDRDAAREKLMREVFHRDINDPSLYHAVWNTSLTAVEEIAPLAALMIENRSRRAFSSMST